MPSQFEIDTIVKGIEISWTAWGKMRDEKLVQEDICYVKSQNGRGFERIFSVNIAEENQEYRIRQMISYMQSGAMPDSMLITPSTRPANLAEILSHEGFGIDNSAPCMMMALGSYEEKPSGLTDFSIIDVVTKKQLSDWLAIISAALFGCELITLEQISDVLAMDNTRLYLGLKGNKPVTACMTIMEGDTSALDMAATREEYRRQGFASALINKALIDLREIGAKTVSLRAEADGVGVYRRLGFKECFKRVVASCGNCAKGL